MQPDLREDDLWRIEDKTEPPAPNIRTTTKGIMTMTRRSFLTAAACCGATAALAAQTQETNPAPASAKRRLKLGVCTYSYWHFRDPKISVEAVIEKAADLGVAGVDLLHRQMDIPEREPLTAAHRAYLAKLKRLAFRNGVELVCLSIHQNFVQSGAFLNQ
jgi:hypothetical protein